MKNKSDLLNTGIKNSENSNLDENTMNQFGVSIKNAKSMIQEICQKQGLPIPEYKLLHRSGPDHNPKFIVEIQVTLQKISGSTPLIAVGEGSSKKIAELNAAEKLCDLIDVHYIPSE